MVGCFFFFGKFQLHQKWMIIFWDFRGSIQNIDHKMPKYLEINQTWFKKITKLKTEPVGFENLDSEYRGTLNFLVNDFFRCFSFREFIIQIIRLLSSYKSPADE